MFLVRFMSLLNNCVDSALVVFNSVIENQEVKRINQLCGLVSYLGHGLLEFMRCRLAKAQPLQLGKNV